MKNKFLFIIILAVFIIVGSISLGPYLKHLVKVIESTNESFPEEGFVTKIIDGDTIIIGGESVRLLGIDADESGYPCYNSAKKRIEELVLNKQVRLEEDGEDKDQYKRYLRYIFLDNKNINLQLVEEGLAVARFSPQNTKYKQEILNAEKQARENGIGCKWGGPESPPEPTPEPAPTPEPEINVIGPCNAGNYIGEEKIVEGKIVDTYKYKTISVFLNFEKPYPNSCFTAVIWSDDWYKFPENPEDYYRGKIVRVQGEIIEYKGTPEIILKDMSQIEVKE